MRPQGGRLSGAERRAVAEYVTGRARRRHHGRHERALRIADTAVGSRRLLVLDHVVTIAVQYAISNDEAGRLERGGCAAPLAEMGVRIPGCDVRVVAANRGGRPPVRRQPKRHGVLARRGERLHRVDLHGEKRRAHGVDIRSRFRRRALRRLLRRHGANVYALDAETGRVLWSRAVDGHPLARITGSITLYQGRLFVPVSSIEETAAAQQGYQCCTFRGS